jgi:hypothetical protein
MWEFKVDSTRCVYFVGHGCRVLLVALFIKVRESPCVQLVYMLL